MSISISIYLDTRRAKQNKKYPVKLRVSDQKSAPVLYSTIFDLSEDEHKKLSARHINADLDEIRRQLRDLEISAIQAAEQLEPFTFYPFERDFVVGHSLLTTTKIKAKPPVAAGNVAFDIQPFVKRFPILLEETSNPLALSTLYAAYVKKLLILDRFGNADNYQNSYKSTKKCWGTITLNEVNIDLLYCYEKWMVNRGRSLTSVGINLRCIRTLFNVAIDAGLVNAKTYPFGQRKYILPVSRNIKKALPKQDVNRIYFYEAETHEEMYGRDMWLFLYQGNGMNPKDMAFLKFRNIDGDFIHFQRAKTKNTTRHRPKIITVFITADMRRIVDKWGNKDRSPGNFIFPIVKSDQSAMEQHYTIKSFTALIGRLTQPIAKALGLPLGIKPSVARHTHATHLKRAGASTEFIQESLGHLNVNTTEYYLDSFEKEVKKEFAEKLFNFKNE